MYKALRNRELNWSWGNVQSLRWVMLCFRIRHDPYSGLCRFLKGHTGFCTTLNLKGNMLLSGSYDECVDTCVHVVELM